MKKKILAAAVCAAMVLSLAGCGSKDDPFANLPQSSAGNTASTPNNSKPASSAAAGNTSKPTTSKPAESKPVQSSSVPTQSSSTPQIITPESKPEPTPDAPVDWDNVPFANDEDFDYNITGNLNNSAAVIKAYIGTSEYVKMPSELGGEKTIELSNSVTWGTNVKAIMLSDGCVLAGTYKDYMRGVWLDNNGIGVGPNVTEIVFADKMTVIGAEGMTNLKRVTLPKYLYEVKPKGFKDSKITELVFPDYTTFIDESAFMGCKNLKSVTFPSGLQAIDAEAFHDCTSLTEINFPESFSSEKCTIVGFAFAGCKKLKSVELPSGVNLDGRRIKSDKGLIFDRVLYNGNNLFSDCTSLEKVTFADDLDYIPNSVFSGCTSLTEVDLPNGLTEIGNTVFYGCTSLSELNLPDGLKKIGYCAFGNCISLKSLTIPDTTKTIGYNLMQGCSDFTISYLGQTFNEKNYVKICNSDGVN